MTLSAHIIIDGHPIDVRRHRYECTWLFRPEDRVIRTRTKGERNQTIRGLPDDPKEWDEPETEYLYVVSADTLRQRLASTGRDRTSLELEFLRYTSAVFKSSSAPYFFRASYPATKEIALARARAFRDANLDDWLRALKVVKQSGLVYWNRHGKDAPADLLVDIVSGHDMPIFDATPPDRLVNGFPYASLGSMGITSGSGLNPPAHMLNGFPCTSLESMAVAMLEISPADAECVFDVSDFVIYGDDHSFDDLRMDRIQM